MRRLLVLLALLIGAATCVATAAADGFQLWQTPSKRIHCAWFSPPSSLRCDIDGGLRPRPKRPAACNLEYGDSIEIGRTGRAALVCHGDTTADPSAKVLAYGTTWKRGGITCTIRQAGVRCANRSGHGFFLSRERWSLF